MNIASATGTDLRTVDLQLSNGNRKALTLSANGYEVSSAKSLALRCFEDLECTVCMDVHEKTLQTRCCGAVICAFCYLSSTQCPVDNQAFSGAITKDLIPAGRLVDNQVEKLSREFKDIEAEETDHGKEMAQSQNKAINRLEGSEKNTQHNVNASASASVDATQTPRRPKFDVNISSSTGPVIIGNNNRLAIRGNSLTAGGNDSFNPNRFLGNIIGPPPGARGGSPSEVSAMKEKTSESPGSSATFKGDITLPPRYMFSSDVLSRNQSGGVRAFHYPQYDTNCLFDVLGVNVGQGNIVITGQDSDCPYIVSVVASTTPILRNNQLSVSVGVGNVELKLPDAFSKRVRIITDQGNISTQGNYAIKSGGQIRITTAGNITIKIDSQWVNFKTQINIGYINVQESDKSIDWMRRTHRQLQELLVSANCGNIQVANK
ncbi:hypothetical protein [Endozoicomonas sp. ONNA2]|uniref:hypothetical protein n=1 Tax=Endozoicomonas sp. ONNA2 TaxID=2828741 RepID=UPI002147BC1F|nr:hypothetical protein [Endozoicomonas sp. ONNA2]